jgi:Uma2 family endonuclease
MLEEESSVRHEYLDGEILLVEVTSNSSEDYDRGDKLRHYQRIASAKEILIISHRERRISLHRRVDDAWIALEARAGESHALESIGGTLHVDELYSAGLEDS